MGRPLGKKFFGSPASAGNQLNVEAWIPGGAGAVSAWVVSQKSNTTYIVTDGVDTGRCKLQDTTITGAGQMRITAMPFGFNAATTGAVLMKANSAAITAAGTGYTVGNVLTVVGGTGTAATFTVSSVGGLGEVTGVTLTGAGVYSALPTNPAATTVSPAGGTGATLTVSWGVLSVALATGGLGYTSAPAVTFSSGAATATTTVSSGSVTAIVIGSAGTYTTIPTATIAAPSGDMEYVRTLTAHTVKTFTGNVYKWDRNNPAAVAGEADLDFS